MSDRCAATSAAVASSADLDVPDRPGEQNGTMLRGRRLVVFLALAASSALTVALGVTDPSGSIQYPTKFLVWNLFLAWIPLILAMSLRGRRRPLGWLLGLAWLAFLPNAPYLVTDLVHLGDGDDHLWRHILQFGSAAWTGTLLGVVSLRVVHVEIERVRGRMTGWSVVAASVGLCAVGVVIGRFQRWNSWDLVTRPRAVAASTLDWVGSPFSDVQSTGVALAVAAFFGLAYLTAWGLDGFAGPPHSESD